LIFLLPAVALVYFSFYFISMKYKELNMTSSLLSSSKMTKSISIFIHNIQLERGLSGGYIVAVNKKEYKNKLLKQQKFTDMAYHNFLKYINLYSKNRNKTDEMIFYKNRPKISEILKHLHMLKSIRKAVFNSSVDFEKEIDFYTYINTRLIEIIQTLTSPFSNYNGNSIDIYKLQCLEENAGLERAYVYNLLLSRKQIDAQFDKITDLIRNQESSLKEFLAEASLQDLSLYNHTFLHNSKNKNRNCLKI